MSPSESDDDVKNTRSQKVSRRSEPLCLFCFPEDVSCVSSHPPRRKTYVNVLPRKESDIRRIVRGSRELESALKKPEGVRSREDVWLRRRTEARIRRRRMKEPIRNLRTYFLTVKHDNVPRKSVVPSLFDVLETVKDAWPPPPTRTLSLRHEDQMPEETKGVTPKKDIMTGEQIGITPQLLNRRLSVPEELMRKYSVTKEGTSEESETNKTMIEITPSSTTTEETARRKSPEKTLEKEAKTVELLPDTDIKKQQKEMKDAYQQTNGFDYEPEENKQTEMPKRVTQSDYYNQGKQILKVKAFEKSSTDDRCTCRDEKPSSTTASAKEETDESVTTDSIPSSSPTQLPKRESSSGNLSSESDHVRCTCNELTSSKDTSTDIFHSGKSTLSQTVSDKSISTQDSTVSINSVSTRGSTVSDNSNSTTPEVDRTSAKETTTSPDYSPRTPRSNMNRKNRRRDRYHSHYEDHKKTCPKYHQNKHSRNYENMFYGRQCPIHTNAQDEPLANRERQQQQTIETNQAKEEVEVTPISQTEDVLQRHYNQTQNLPMEIIPNEPPRGERYKWAKLSQEELYMMQQLRHRKFIENQKKSALSVETTPETQSIDACETETGNVYKGIDYIEQPILIPRYSALPRTLSMIVNTSSGDTSVHNSDSDNQSLADSLEDQPTTHVHKLYFDTKKESKPVRGDVNIVQDSKLKHRQPRGRAFFVSIKEPYGEDEMLENIEKIPQPPEKIKNQISERHLNISTKHKHLHNKTDQKQKTQIHQKKRKTKNGKNDENEKSSRTKKFNKETNEDGKRDNQKLRKNGTTKPTKNDVEEERKSQSKPKQQERKLGKNPKAEEDTKGTSKRKRESKEQTGRFSSKIPVPVSSRSTSSSPERDDEDKPSTTMTRPRTRLRRERESSIETDTTQKTNPKTSDVETTQILEITQTGNELSLHKPHAVIHPSQIPFNDVEQKHPLIIPPLLPNLRMPTPPFQPNFRQTPIYNKQLLLHQLARRSPVPKFRQRFEVIPEEKSSSLSSAEEKNPKESSTKFAEASTSPLPDENVKKLGKIQFQSYNVTEVPNLIVAKITNEQLETLKVNDNQKIIMISSKGQNSNSTKGRDALIAMNREDFNRLAKGWMNFYRLNENGEGSDNEENHKTEVKRENNKDKSRSRNEQNHENKSLPPINTDTPNPQSSQHPFKPEPHSDKCLSNNETKKEMKNNSAQVDLSDNNKETLPEKENRTPEIDENIRFHSSNTILRSVKATSFESTSGRITKRQNSLPELRISNQKNRQGTKSKPSDNSLPRVNKYLEDDNDDTDSDSTDYMEPPSPRVPPLSLGDFPSDATISSSDSELEEPKPKITTQSLDCFQGKKRGGTNRAKQKKENSFESLRFGKKKNSEWSVTVAGTVELSRSHPDLEMRLSFPVKGSPPVVCQSDSGFAEDSNYSKPNESLQDLDFYTFRKKLPVNSNNMKQKWSVTVKNPKQGEAQELTKQKLLSNSNHLLPDLDTTQNRSAKKVLKATLRNLIKRKMYAIWPKVQRVIRQEFSTQSGRLVTDFEDFNEELCLSVRGNAISLERKQKPLTMTERDVTRRYTSRTSREEPVPLCDDNQNGCQINEKSTRSVV